MSLKFPVGALLIFAICSSSSAFAQTPARVRVTNGPAPIKRWLHAPATEILREVATGTTLDVLDKELDWFWVVVPPDMHGTRKAGWIRASNVEPVAAAAESLSPQHDHSDHVTEPSSATDAPSAVAEDKVTITERRDDAAAPDTGAASASAFDDVHFDRDRYALRSEDMDTLRTAAAALKADPSLVVNIAGYTCSLGSTAHNRALSARRANAVKEYLVNEGIAADRLHTVGVGEADAKHDNSNEDSRRLNRRVAIVPDVQR